jgi:hypothetical protein
LIVQVSVSITEGTVYFWPESEAAKACIVDSSDTSCNYLRQKVDGAVFKNGFVTFPVGSSVTQPAGGFYIVSAGSDVGVIVGATAACVCLTLIVILSAIYFRKHPQHWDSFKAWGPNTMKNLRRSLASQV